MNGQFQDTTKTKIQNAIRKIKELTPNQRLIENKKFFDALKGAFPERVSK